MPRRYPIMSDNWRPCTESREGQKNVVGLTDRLIRGWRSTDPTARRIYDSDYGRFRSDSDK